MQMIDATRIDRAFSRGDPDGRAFDVIIALALILFAAPLFIIVALSLRLTDHGTVLVGQERIGLDGRIFRCMRFRCTVEDTEGRLTTRAATDPRLTPFGEFLRRSSLDALPQLFNVLRGEMSLVGPVPMRRAEAALYGARFASYCAVRPGITGLFQISDRSDVSDRRRVAMDTVYARGKCLSWDLKIMAMTLPAMLAARGT